MQIVDTIKKHKRWLIWGAVAIGGVILFMLLSRGGGGGGAVAGGSDPNAAINAELSLRQMEMQGQLAIAGMQAQIAENAGQRELEALAMRYNSEAQIADLSAAATLEAMAMQSAESRYIADRQYMATTAQISSQENLAIAQMESAAYRDKLSADLALSQQEMYAQMTMAQTQAQVDMLASQLQAQATMHAATVGSQVDLAQIQAARDTRIAQSQADAQRDQGFLGLIGGIATGILGIFSDVRGKKNIEYAGYDEGGVPKYSYSYLNSDQRHYGVLAQEAERFYPSAVNRNGRHLTVDYRRIG